MLDLASLIGAVQCSESLSSAINILFWNTVSKHATVTDIANNKFAIPQHALRAFECALQDKAFINTLAPYDQGVLSGALSLLKGLGPQLSTLSLDKTSVPTPSSGDPALTSGANVMVTEAKKRAWSAIAAQPALEHPKSSSTSGGTYCSYTEANTRLARLKGPFHYDGCTRDKSENCPLCTRVFSLLQLSRCEGHSWCAAVGWYPHWEEQARLKFLSYFPDSDPHKTPPRGLLTMSVAAFLGQEKPVILSLEEAERRRQAKKSTKSKGHKQTAAPKKKTSTPAAASSEPQPSTSGTQPAVNAGPIEPNETSMEAEDYVPRSPSPLPQDWAAHVESSLPPVYTGEGGPAHHTRSQAGPKK